MIIFLGYRSLECSNIALYSLSNHFKQVILVPLRNGKSTQAFSFRSHSYLFSKYFFGYLTFLSNISLPYSADIAK